MNDWDFADFQGKLMEAIRMFSKDKCAKVETYIDYEGTEYKVVIKKGDLTK